MALSHTDATPTPSPSKNQPKSFWSRPTRFTRHTVRAAAVLLVSLVAAALLGPAAASSQGSTDNPPPPAPAQGYTDSPPSRGLWCKVDKERVGDCGPIQYEPQSVEGPKGFPSNGPANGELCSAGKTQFNPVNEPLTPKGDTWPVTAIRTGKPLTFQWTLTTPRRTTDWRYYFTKPGYDYSHPLTREDLDVDHPIVFPYHGDLPGNDVEHRIDRYSVPNFGRHMILAVWNIDDTETAFYSCTDMLFY